MGTPGVPWEGTKVQILASIKKQHGRVTYVAKELNCDYITVKKRIDADPELTKALADARSGFGETLLDMSESALMRGLTNEDPNAYLKSAFYVLNNKGKERGYSHAVLAPQSERVEQLIIQLKKPANVPDQAFEPKAAGESERGNEAD
jgi:hypothetical protein